MTTPSSPSSLSFSQINTEIQNASNSPLNMGNSKLRGLFQDFSGDISMSSGRSKTYTVKTVFTTTGATTFVVPTIITSINVKLWGSGGGGGEGATGSGGGGSGGFVSGTIAVTPGESLYVFIPTGGIGESTAGKVSGAGGSWSGIFRNTTPLMIAGGGGGGGPDRSSSSGGNGGAGGGITGGAGGQDSNNDGHQGFGGSQTAGGAAGSGGGNQGEVGGYLRGGDGAAQTTIGRGNNGAGAILGNARYGTGGAKSTQGAQRSGGGGGGGGYYGGGGAAQGSDGTPLGGAGGGGGSSYTGGAVAGTATNTQGSIGSRTANVSPPNTGDADYVAYGASLSVGVGLKGHQEIAAGRGMVVISWTY